MPLAEELKALSEATQVLQSETSAAQEQMYSLLVSRISAVLKFGAGAGEDPFE